MALLRVLPLSLPTLDLPVLLDALPPGPGQFVLESGASGPAAVRRHTFVGAEPFMTLVTHGREAYVHEPGGTRVMNEDPFTVLQSLLDRCRMTTDHGRPGQPPGAAVGYLSYDLGRRVERLPATARDDLGMPEVQMGFYDVMVAIDHETGEATLLIGAPDGREAEAAAKAARWARALKAAAPPAAAPAAPPAPGKAVSSLTRAAYRDAVNRALTYIGAGDIFQVNLAQRFSCPWSGTGRDLYHRLRQVSPAPFSAYLELGSWQVVSCSPERLIAVDGRRIETRPIKGTRPRGDSAVADQAAAAELLASEKDQAELTMTVDLMRNDLGRVCEFGSVTVPDLRRLEATPSVWHTVATVEGRLRSDVTSADVLRAVFPGGSITGAPKVRAMAIIEELEPVRRGVYTGAIGYIGFDGRMDFNIAIRTAVVGGGKAYFHAGGAIVADSDPSAEYAETIAKAAGLALALGVSLDDLP